MKEDKRGQRFEGVAHERGGREAESHNEGQRLIRGKGVEGRDGGAEGWRGGGEPTGEGRRSEPVERRQPGAGVPEALQLGIVRCPPPPRGSRQGGGQAGREGRGKGTTPGKEGTTPTAQGTRDTRHMENARDKPSNKTKQNKNKEKIKISWCSESGSRPHAGERLGGGCQTRREGGSRVLLPQGQGGLLLSCRTPHLSLFSPQHGASRGLEMQSHWPTTHLSPRPAWPQLGTSLLSWSPASFWTQL